MTNKTRPTKVDPVDFIDIVDTTAVRRKDARNFLDDAEHKVPAAAHMRAQQYWPWRAPPQGRFKSSGACLLSATLTAANTGILDVNIPRFSVS